jgi:eukaryotic-like serine/threonine-protein kinase
MTSRKPKDSQRQVGIEGSQLGPYLVGGRLGIGGAAAVYLGLNVQPSPQEHASPQDVVALKVIHEHLALEREFVQMFLDEARVAVLLQHPNVVRTFALGQQGERLYMAMEYLHGQSLHEVFVRGTKHGARLPVDLVAWIGAQVARALHYAHTLQSDSGQPLHLVHRDVSPRNIFIAYDGSVKLIDFGIAHAIGRTTKTKVGQMKGTFSYIAPERALGGACDHRADLFSLAAALFEAATGQRLFRGQDDVQTLRNVLSGKVPDPRELRDGFPDELARILLKALSTHPDARHPTALALADELDAFVAASGLEPPQPRLSLMMSTIFAEDRTTKDTAIAQVRALAVPENESPEEPPLEVSNLVVSHSRPPTDNRPSRVWMAVSAVLATTALAAAAAMFTNRPSPAPAHSASAMATTAPDTAEPSASTVMIDVSAVPAVEATFELGGRSITGSVARFEPLRGSAPVTVLVRAEGYEDARMDVIPDENRTVAVPLRERVKPPVAESAPPTPPRVATRESSAPRTKPQPTLTDLLNKRH